MKFPNEFCWALWKNLHPLSVPLWVHIHFTPELTLQLHVVTFFSRWTNPRHFRTRLIQAPVVLPPGEPPSPVHSPPLAQVTWRSVILLVTSPILILSLGWEVRPAAPAVGSWCTGRGISPASAGGLYHFTRPCFLQDLWPDWEDWGLSVLPLNTASLIVKEKPRLLAPLAPAQLHCRPRIPAPFCPFLFIFWRWAFKLQNMCWRHAY